MNVALRVNTDTNIAVALEPVCALSYFVLCIGFIHCLAPWVSHPPSRSSLLVCLYAFKGKTWSLRPAVDPPAVSRECICKVLLLIACVCVCAHSGMAMLDPNTLYRDCLCLVQMMNVCLSPGCWKLERLTPHLRHLISELAVCKQKLASMQLPGAWQLARPHPATLRIHGQPYLGRMCVRVVAF